MYMLQIAIININKGNREAIMNKQFLSKKEAMAYLGVSLSKLNIAIKNNEIIYTKLGEGQQAKVVFEKENLDLYIQNLRLLFSIYLILHIVYL